MKKIRIVILFNFFRPTFYTFSPAFARVSDFASYLLFVSSIRKIPKSILPMFMPLVAYLVVQIISIIYAANTYSIIIKDLIPLAVPFIMFIGLALGSKINLSSVSSLLISIAIVNVCLGFFMLLYPEQFKFLYTLFNVPNLFQHGRPGGIMYTHTEYGMMSLIGFILVMRNNNYFWPVFCFFLFSLVVSMSKAIIISYLISGGLYLICYRRSQFIIISILFASAIFVFSSLISQLLLEYVPYVWRGFLATFDAIQSGQSNDGSVGPRLNDYLVLISSWDDPFVFFLGNSPLRYYEFSYIESTFPNVFFRFGVLGIISYYTPMLIATFIWLKRNDPLWILFPALFVGDLFANVTESVKIMPILFLLIGTIFYADKQNRKLKRLGDE